MSGDSGRSAAGTNVALLRGINVGGKNKLPMKDLAAMFRETGCSDVRTYIQSGNVLFRADPTLAEDIPSLISESILSRFGYRVPVITRTARQLQQVVKANPLAESGAEANRLLVLFLADLPDRARVEALDPNRSPGDEFAVLGREVFLHCPNGVCAQQAHQQLLRLQPLDHQHGPELENGEKAPRVGHRGRVIRSCSGPAINRGPAGVVLRCCQ